MPEHICRKAFIDFSWYDMVKPLEIWSPKLSIENNDRSIWIGSWVFVITFEKVWFRPKKRDSELQTLVNILPVYC